MPEMYGIALALKVSKDWPELPILLMTGYATERQQDHNLDTLIHDVIRSRLRSSRFATLRKRFSRTGRCFSKRHRRESAKAGSIQKRCSSRLM